MESRWFNSQKVHTFSVRTVGSAGRGQHSPFIRLSYCLKTSLPGLWGQLFYNKQGKSNMFPLPVHANAMRSHVEVTLCKLLTYTSLVLSQMVKDRCINAALTIFFAQGPLTTPRSIHPLMQGIGSASLQVLGTSNMPSLSPASSPKGLSSTA